MEDAETQILRKGGMQRRFLNVVIMVLFLVSIIITVFICQGESTETEGEDISIVIQQLKSSKIAEKIHLQQVKEIVTIEKKQTEITTSPLPRIPYPHLIGEVDLLAQIIECEAGKGYAEHFWSGSVVINRIDAEDGEFANVNTIKEVLEQRGQYDSKTKEEIRNGIEPSEMSLEIARGLIFGTIEIPDKTILFQMQYEPTGSWAQNLERVNLPGTYQYYARLKK